MTTKDTSEVSFDTINKLIPEVDYIKDFKSNQSRAETSLSYIVNRTLSQSDCIKLGNAFEQTLTYLTSKLTNYKNIRPPNKKGNKEKDILYCDNINKVIFYAEVKSNLDLDTEKSKATYNKCINIQKELKLDDYKIKWCLLCVRYIHSDYFPPRILKKYKCIIDNVFGINQYFSMLGINCKLTEEEHIKFVNNIVEEMFKDNKT
jgi:hypothetical protein